jgi:hypothetical protein
MQRFAALVATGLFVVSCSPEGEVTESTNKSATTSTLHTIRKCTISALMCASNVTTVS